MGLAMLPLICDTVAPVAPVALLTDPEKSSGVEPTVISLSAVAFSENEPLVLMVPERATVPPLPSSAVISALPVVWPLLPGTNVSLVVPDQPVGRVKKAKLGVEIDPVSCVAWPLPEKTRLSGVVPTEIGAMFQAAGNLSVPDVISMPAGE